MLKGLWVVGTLRLAPDRKMRGSQRWQWYQLNRIGVIKNQCVDTKKASIYDDDMSTGGSPPKLTKMVEASENVRSMGAVELFPIESPFSSKTTAFLAKICCTLSLFPSAMDNNGSAQLPKLPESSFRPTL